jgi:hypothetical protein
VPEETKAKREEASERTFGPKEQFTKIHTLGVIVAGAIMLAVPWFIPSAQAGISVIGFIVLCLGMYFRP